MQVECLIHAMIYLLYGRFSIGEHGVRGSNDGVVTYRLRSSEYSSYIAIFMNA